MLSYNFQLIFSIVAVVQAAPFIKRNELFARKLLGSSFGVPGNASYDYVIVGGGNAGLTVAARLAENPRISVAVIEAGSFYEIENGNFSQIPAYDIRGTGKDPEDTNRVDWGFVTAPQKELLNAEVHYPRGKTLGGSTARNYMAYHRGTKGTYQKWAHLVGDDSYTFENFGPYFEKSLNFTKPKDSRASNASAEYDLSTMGRGNGPLSITFSNYANSMSSWVQRGLAEIGIKPQKGFTSGSLNGSAYVLQNIDATLQTRDSSETAYLQPALKKTTLQVYQSTLAKRILFDRNKKATGVLVDSSGLSYVLSANKEVIISAGAFQSPQLLMVSGVGPKATLKKHGIPVIADRPGVGQNMWDHVFMGPSYRVNVITSSSLGNADFLHEAERLYNEKQEGILTNSGGDFFAWEKIPPSLRSCFPKSTLSALASFPSDWPEVEYISLSAFLGYQENYIRDAPTDGYNYATVSIALVAPLSRGTIDIRSADTADPPIIDPRWLSHPADRALVVAGYKRVRELFSTKAIKPVLIGPEYFPGPNVTTDEEILEVIRKTVSTVYHAACTCAMGKSNDPYAVVDSKARVFGVEGLRVVDASSFPLLPPGHPVATVYALAEKISHDILKG
ncbi:GMC oxidoreductase [Periconia macrospinosa]|uniref:GMC oxidoreductase n=1 Tax=Periconia macrospinosa TaxID=97972 RepID=A0A2V1DCR3_9PLEO|nr:GMC oxidoreductase [Periconia macrospinosa]